MLRQDQDTKGLPQSQWLNTKDLASLDTLLLNAIHNLKLNQT